MDDNKIANFPGLSIAKSELVPAIREKYAPIIGPTKKPTENAPPMIA